MTGAVQPFAAAVREDDVKILGFDRLTRQKPGEHAGLNRNFAPLRILKTVGTPHVREMPADERDFFTDQALKGTIGMNYVSAFVYDRERDTHPIENGLNQIGGTGAE